MSVKLLTEHHLEFLKVKKEAAKACLSLHLSKCNIVGNHISQIIYTYGIHVQWHLPHNQDYKMVLLLVLLEHSQNQSRQAEKYIKTF